MKAACKFTLAGLREENRRLKSELNMMKSSPLVKFKTKPTRIRADFNFKSCGYLHNNKNFQINEVDTAIDVMERAEDEIKQQESEHLKHLNDLLENILYILTHDLKEPISNMQMATYLINSLDDVNKKLLLLDIYKPMLDQMEKTIKGVTEVLQNQKNKENSAGNIKMDVLVDDILSEFKGKLNPDEIHCNFSTKRTINYVEPFLVSVLRNLINNAIKYRREDVPLKIELETSLTDEYVLLKVKDNGIGIDLEKHLSQLYTPFVRINAKKTAGTGIGLYLVKTIIEENGGYIDVQSTPGEGTTFFCYMKEYENLVQPD